MKKIIFTYILFFLIFISNVYSLDNEQYNCKYKYNKDEIVTIRFAYTDAADSEASIQMDIENANPLFGVSIAIVDYEFGLLTAEQQEELEKNFKSGICDSTLMLYKWFNNGTQAHMYGVLFNDTLEAQTTKLMEREANAIGGTDYKELENGWLTPIPNQSTGEFGDIVYKCDGYENIYEILENNYNEIKKCSGQCENFYNDYNTAKDKLKSFCSIQYEHTNYGNSCLSRCLGITGELEKVSLEKYEVGQCNVTEKLIIFFKNILRWIKYIIPVAVIVLGILDFIKGMGSEKEDEMKKAQGRFVKRLIAAALIFLVPLIIEFVLGKMGFDYSDCGLFQ